MAEVVTTPDGRQLAYLEVGDPHGPLVLHNHGGPSSRLEARLQAACAATNGLRLVCVDRSGRNLQTPVPNAFAHGSAGLVRDAQLLYRRWAFDVKKIERPVHLWQGLDDTLVPDPINKAVADAMTGAVWHPVGGAGHFVAVGAGDQIFAIAAKELGTS